MNRETRSRALVAIHETAADLHRVGGIDKTTMQTFDALCGTHMREKGSPHLTRGNMLDDLGFSPSEALEIKVKAEIYRDLLQYIQERGFAQQELGTLLGIHQPDVSNLLNGRVSKFSVGKLIKFAGKLNLQAQVKLTKPRAAKLPAVTASTRPQKRSSIAA